MAHDTAPAAAAPPRPALPPLRRPQLEAAVGWLAAAGLLFLAAVTTAVALESRGRFIKEAVSRAEAAAHVLAEHAARLFDAADLLVEHAAQLTRDLDWDEVESSRRLWESLRSEEARLPFLDAVWLNDAGGRLRLTTVVHPPPPTNAADRDFFRAHLSGSDQPYISERIVGRVTQRPSFLVTRRLAGPDGAFRGIAAVTVDPVYFAAFYRRLDLPYEPDIALFRAADFGVLIHQPEAPLHNRPPAPVPAAGQRSVLASPASGTVLDDGFIFTHRRVESWPVHVAVRTDLAPVLAAWRSSLAPYGWLAAAAAAALLALSAFGFRQARAARLVQRGLEERVCERTASLRAALGQRDTALAEKDLLMREVNHRVKNSLQVVSGLLALQGQNAGSADLRAQLGAAGRRVRAVSDIHQLLYKVEDLRVIPFHDYLAALCRDLERSVLAEEGDWRVELAVEPVEVPSDQAVPLGLIANELLMNAIKHAYPDGGPKPLTVGLARTGAGVLRLTVEDRGVGMPAGFDWRRSASLGMRLVHALAGQLGAALTAEAGAPGVRFSVEVPLAAAS